MRRPRIAASLLACGAAAALSAAPAAGLDLSGTITVREASTTAGGGTKDVTTQWTLRGGLASGPAVAVAPSTPSVLAYSERTSYVNDYGEPICYFTAYDGWVPGAQNPVSQDVALDFPAKDLLGGRVRASVSLLDRGPAALTSSANCGETPQPVDPVQLLASENQSEFLYRRALMGVGNLELTRAGAITVLEPGAALAPGSVTFRLRGGHWRSDGVRIRSGTYRAGILGSGSRTVRVEWHLSSRDPSRSCTLPRRARVRGTTVAATSRLLRRAGLRPGALIRDPHLPVGRGRVAELWDPGVGVAPCGSRIAMWMRP